MEPFRKSITKPRRGNLRDLSYQSLLDGRVGNQNAEKLSEAQRKVLLKISNTIGKELFLDSTKMDGGVAYPVTYVAMEPGEYTIQIVDEKGRQIQQLHYQIQNAHTGFHITKIPDEDNYPLPLSHPNNKVIHVRIFDKQNKLVH